MFNVRVSAYNNSCCFWISISVSQELSQVCINKHKCKFALLYLLCIGGLLCYMAGRDPF